MRPLRLRCKGCGCCFTLETHTKKHHATLYGCPYCGVNVKRTDRNPDPDPAERVLTMIACYEDQPKGSKALGSLDEPGSAQLARDYLESKR